MKISTRNSPTRRAAIVGSIGAAVLGTAGVAGTLRAPQASADALRGGADTASAPGAPAAANDTSFTLFEGRQSEEFECFRIPSLLTTPAGTTIAFVEGRRAFDGEDFCYDDGSIDIVMKRSSNGGTDWDPQEVILTGNPWGGTARATRGNPVPIVLTQGKNAGRIVLLTTWNQAGTRDKRIPFVMHSDDDGKTWSEAVSLEDQLKGGDGAPSDGWYATGPQHGIQMVHGEHAGRLVAGVYYEGGMGAIIFSDDDGASWTQGTGITGPQGRRPLQRGRGRGDGRRDTRRHRSAQG
ncbi:exo-alpha-sialidase [Brachybacterium sp. AOP3-A1-3]|uniref:exo-alpha-sialidase n=1 Tax=Brachybacterium sp. AOP3-A1-3 TaxID=3457699 RepID=UPI004034272A